MKEILIELIRVAPIALGYLAGKWHRKSKPINKFKPINKSKPLKLRN